MSGKVFNPAKLAKLNNPQRLKDIPIDRLWKWIGSESPVDTLVDVGAGTGFYCIPLLQYVKTIHACDISPVMVDWMKSNLSAYPSIHPHQMNDNALPLETLSAQVVTMMNLVHELDSPEKLFSEVRRVLTDSGKVCIVDWKYEGMEDGPPLKHRLSSDLVVQYLDNTGYRDACVINDLEKHYVIIASK